MVTLPCLTAPGGHMTTPTGNIAMINAGNPLMQPGSRTACLPGHRTQTSAKRNARPRVDNHRKRHRGHPQKPCQETWMLSDICPIEKEFHSGLAGTEHLPDLGIPFEDVIRRRELSLQCADQWPHGHTFGRDDTRHGPAMAGQFNRLTSFGTANQLGEASFGFCDRNLHETNPTESDRHVGRTSTAFKGWPTCP